MNDERVVRITFDEERAFGFSFATLKLLTKDLGGSLENQEIEDYRTRARAYLSEHFAGDDLDRRVEGLVRLVVDFEAALRSGQIKEATLEGLRELLLRSRDTLIEAPELTD